MINVNKTFLADIDYIPAEYQLRPYQNELVAYANSGRSTIICAPTGCGKTLVATDIVINHLRNCKKEGKVGRVFFLYKKIICILRLLCLFLRYL